jgi:hypothetical protein
MLDNLNELQTCFFASGLKKTLSSFLALAKRLFPQLRRRWLCLRGQTFRRPLVSIRALYGSKGQLVWASQKIHLQHHREHQTSHRPRQKKFEYNADKYENRDEYLQTQMCPLLDQKHYRTHDAESNDDGEIRWQKLKAHAPERGAAPVR